MCMSVRPDATATCCAVSVSPGLNPRGSHRPRAARPAAQQRSLRGHRAREVANSAVGTVMGRSPATEICLVGPFAGRTHQAPAQGAGRNMLSRTVPTLASLDIKGQRMTEPSTGWQLDDITYSGGTQDGPRANVKLSRAEEQVHAEGSGTGLIDAVCHSISQATGVEARVVAFRAYSVGPGSEAVGEVELEVELPGRRIAVRASSTDVVEAAGLALVAALNQYNAKRQAQG